MIKFLAVAGLLSLFQLAPLFADIAPTEFVGAGIKPTGNTVVRMEKAVVDIVWGTPCSLTATFTMVNPSNEPQKLEIGFPVMPGLVFENPGMKPSPLSIAFDDAEATVEPPIFDHGMAWYRCPHAFKPGTTIVTVKTALLSSGVYASGFHESLFYCIETGGKWAGTIGEETVTIRFPHPIQKDQIVGAAPAGCQIEGDSVRWRLVNIEPKGKEFDITLTYIRPDAMQVIAALRRDVAQKPESAAPAIRLARNLLALGNSKSNSGFPPSRLSQDAYVALLSKITGTESRSIFIRHYSVIKDGVYFEAGSKWTKDRIALIRILANADYRDEDSKTPFILEAESLLTAVIKREPHNAEAWNVYLANYWRFSFAAVGHWFGSTEFSEAQIQAIKTAAKNCPDDKFIQDWLKLTRTNKRGINELMGSLENAGYYRIDLPTPQRRYY
ncbi:MAG: hypothetical protein QM760_01550 [Nibricoccus sp.]